jgi:hypothetical protein
VAVPHSLDAFEHRTDVVLVVAIIPLFNTTLIPRVCSDNDVLDDHPFIVFDVVLIVGLSVFTHIACLSRWCRRSLPSAEFVSFHSAKRAVD